MWEKKKKKGMRWCVLVGASSRLLVGPVSGSVNIYRAFALRFQASSICLVPIRNEKKKKKKTNGKPKKEKRTAPNRSFNFPATPPGPGGTCFPGIPVTLMAAFLFLIPTRHSSKKSRSCTAVKISEGSLLGEARWDFAWGVVMMGRSERREEG